MKKMELTMLIEKGEDGYYVGQIQEYPPVMSQGETIDELELNLKDAYTVPVPRRSHCNCLRIFKE
jgi:predicted RNase H-like HicB family nuclease